MVESTNMLANAPPDTTTNHPTHIPNAGGNIRQPPQLLNVAGPHLLHRIPGGLGFWRTPRRLQLQTDGIVHRKPGIRPKRQEEGNSPRPRLIHIYDQSFLVVLVLHVWKDTPW